MATRNTGPDESPRDAVGLRRLVGLLDLTDLDGSATPARIHTLCARALRPAPGHENVPHVAAVCVHSARVVDARAALDSFTPPDIAARPGSCVRLASVAGGFPAGQTFLDVKLHEIRRAIEAGADEIDLVLDRGAFLDADADAGDAKVRLELEACREVTGGATLKVILETGAFIAADNSERWPGATDRLRTLARLAIEAGADFLKTSTGTLQPGATPEVAALLLEEIAAQEEIAANEAARGGEAAPARAIGLKVAGGIRRVEDALGYLRLVEAARGPSATGPAHFRIGASALLDEITSRLEASPGNGD